jgi:hypothetical protein
LNIKTEPLTAEEPLDESLAYQVDQAKKELENATEAIVETRAKVTKVMTELVATIVDAESKEALLATIVDSSRTENHPEKIDKDNIKIVESDYDEAIEMLARLDKSVPSNISKLECIHHVLNSNK